MDNKKSFNDYLKIIKEEKTEQDVSLKEKKILKEKSKNILEEININKEEKQKEKSKKNKKFSCPIETSDVNLNLKNRQKAIDEFGYGPLNPVEENKTFWEEKVNKWRLESIEEAKTSLCGNCAAFVITKDMLKCISDGLTTEETISDNSWDVIDAGQLGYCEAFDFKCSALRTCDAWIVGGPITDKKKEMKND
jgi:hypothetical protein